MTEVTVVLMVLLMADGEVLREPNGGQKLDTDGCISCLVGQGALGHVYNYSHAVSTGT